MNSATYTGVMHCTNTYLLGGQIQWKNDRGLQRHSSSNWPPLLEIQVVKNASLVINTGNRYCLAGLREFY